MTTGSRVTKEEETNFDFFFHKFYTENAYVIGGTSGPLYNMYGLISNLRAVVQ